jgi:hypothetical protein
VLVRSDDPVLLQQARDSWRSLTSTSRSAEKVSASLGAEDDADSPSISTAEVHAQQGLTAAELEAVLTRTWLRIPTEPVPILSKVRKVAFPSIWCLCVRHQPPH